MNRKIRSIVLGSAAVCLSAVGCSSSRVCCKPCMGEGVPLENVVAFGAVEGDNSGTIIDGQIVPGPGTPIGSTGAAPAAPTWQSPLQGQQVPPTVHPSPPPRTSTSGKVDEQGVVPEVIKEIPKETGVEPRKLSTDKVDLPPVKKDDSKTLTPVPVKKSSEPPVRQQAPQSKTDNLDVPKPPMRNTDLRPASLRVKVSTSMVVTSVGDRVTFDIVVENQGGMSISNVDLQVILNENLKPLDSEPMNAGRIDRNTVNFGSIKNLGSTPQRFKVRAEVVKQDGGVGLITVEALSPILTSGPLRDQATVRILPKE